MLKFKNPTYEDLESKEWLVANGIGGYASGTLSGSNTRRYQGLLVASLNPPTQRQVLITKIEETLTSDDGEHFELSSNKYPDVVYPDGYQYVKGFERKVFPKINFEVGNKAFSKEIFMPHGSNTTIVEYKNTGKSEVHLKITPFFVNRDYHSMYHENSESNFYFTQEDKTLEIYSHYGALPLWLNFTKGNFEEHRYWVKNLEYTKETYRGLDDHEDAYVIGQIILSLKPREKAYVTAGIDKSIFDDKPENLKKKEESRLNDLVADNIENEFIKDLIRAGDQFIVHRQSTDSKSIIAGYHWFTDWGRDTMIAMRGLSIATGKKEISKSILETFLSSIDKGMLPNRFSDFADEDVEYNTVDATLWLFIALFEYYQKFEDKAFIEEHFNKLTNIIDWHIKGTRYNIHLTDKGFIFAGEGINQLTWMDARVGDYVVTPRHGCPVEIQALWYNALQILIFFEKELKLNLNNETFSYYKDISQRLKGNFSKYFLNESGYLNDLVIPNSKVDDAIRPNQVYVLSLPYPLLPKTKAKKVLGIIKKELYTPYGLRSLSKEHQEFKPQYGGDQWQRDTAYHQGTVWPFLFGDYFLALKNIEGNTPKVHKKIKNSLKDLKNHFYKEDCIHGISEIFDGLEPGMGRGTPHQAWSISALLLSLLNNN